MYHLNEVEVFYFVDHIFAFEVVPMQMQRCWARLKT